MSTMLYLAFVLIAPIVFVILLRFLRSRLTAIPFYSIGGICFALVGLAVILLVRRDQQTVQVGKLVVIQPQGIDISVSGSDIQPEIPQQPAIQPTLVILVTSTPLSTATPTVSPTPTASPTPTITPTPPATATPEPTLEPTAEPTAEPAAQPAVRRYTVKAGDTLGKIALRFDTTVGAILRANDMSADQAESIQPGDVLIIP